MIMMIMMMVVKKMIIMLKFLLVLFILVLMVLLVSWVLSMSMVSVQDLVELYVRALQNGGGKTSSSSKAIVAPNTDYAKMSPAEKKKEIARRRAEANKDKVLLYSHYTINRVNYSKREYGTLVARIKNT